MAGSILLNSKKIRKITSDNVNYIDLDYDLKGRRGVSVYYGDAIVMAYILWLRAMPGDFIRNPTKGGFFRNQLNRYTFSPESEAQISADLKRETMQLFTDIEVLDISVKCDYYNRKWKVKVSILDKNTGLMGISSTNINHQ